MKTIEITGNDLTLEQVAAVACGEAKVALARDARRAVEKTRAVVDQIVAGNKVAYAITTGVGKLADVRLKPGEIREVQVNLMRSHAAGVGEPLSEAEVRAMMLLRANSLAKGFSGVRPATIEMLCEMLNRGVHPVVPSQGSVGASGDLAPLGHVGLVLIGEGEAVLDGKRMPGGEALKRAKLKPLVLEAKEAVSLVNGTQAMLGVGVLALLAAETLVDSADVVGALSLDALHGTDTAFDERIHQARPHPGQLQTAQNLRRMLQGSAIRESHRACARVQDAYSLRCMPQVHGAVRDALAHARRVFQIEANAAVDNPLVFAGTGEVLSGGNFHGEPLAFALDFLAIALTALAGISERRIERLVNPALNEGLPPFLAPGAGLHSGFMMAQVTAAALASENKVLAHPASVDSITTSGNKEDYVSMGMAAALKLRKVLENSRQVVAIEAIAAAQGLDFLRPLRTSKRGRAAVAAIRSVCPTVEHDRAMAGDFARVAGLIASGKLVEVLK
ncbi:MAG TPA: histidine ammonia-lyase [Terriglobales bacterium]|nr:histidine ammonia-lyase [Terriglobales bacterium]